MAFGWEKRRDGRWHWWVALSAYGAAVGDADSEDEAKSHLAEAQAELLAAELAD